MKGVAVDADRLTRLAAALREQIPQASLDVARPMIDAAGELQRIADELVSTAKENARELSELLAAALAQSGACDCEDCRAQRAAAKPGLNS